MRLFFIIILAAAMFLCGCAPENSNPKPAKAISLDEDEINISREAGSLASAEAIFIPGQEGCASQKEITLDFQAEPIKIANLGLAKLIGVQNTYPKTAFFEINNKIRPLKCGESLGAYKIEGIFSEKVELARQ